MSDGLRIAVDWERTVDDLLSRTERFPKTMRYVLGARIDDVAIEIALMLTDARFTRGEKRRRTLDDINQRLNRLRLLLRLAHGRQILDHRGFEHVCRQVDAFGSGLGAWMKQAAGTSA